MCRGQIVEEATVRALNFNTLAKATLQVAQTGRKAPDMSREDIEKLPDLGSTFNDTWVWLLREEAQRRRSPLSH
jgi:hypothetical protein